MIYGQEWLFAIDTYIDGNKYKFVVRDKKEIFVNYFFLMVWDLITYYFINIFLLKYFS